MNEELHCPACGGEHGDADERMDCCNRTHVGFDIRLEERMLKRKHRILPSGDVEFADEYGGY